MPSFGDRDDRDGSTCSGCGVYMEVIGPPGPMHKDGCPHKTPPPPPSREVSDVEVSEVFRRMGQGEDVETVFHSMFPDEF